MESYWVVSPYDSTQVETFDKAWSYDQRHNTIAVGWAELGDISGFDDAQLEERYWETFPNGRTQDLNQLRHFWQAIKPGDIIIARRGRKQVAGIGKVEGPPFYDETRGRERLGQASGDLYPNFLPAKWESGEREFPKIVFAIVTLYQISSEKYTEIFEPTLDQVDEEKTEFALEKYLEEFLVSNFGTIFHGALEYGDQEGNPGQQYPTEIGNIDILAREADSDNYVVIELKKGRGSDEVVGQVLRYMGWVKANLCHGQGQDVRGLVICKESNDRLEYALNMVPNVEVQFYQIDFRLIGGEGNQISGPNGPP